MDKFLETLESLLINFECGSNDLKKDLEELICSKGKRIRPRLAYLMISAHLEEVSKKQAELIAAGELLHTASLIHDDIIDDSDTRRGTKTLHKKYNPRLAVITGDLVASVAMNKILDIENREIHKLFNETFQIMCNAEISQYFSRGTVPLLSDYLEKSKNKTGMLFGIILKSVAILGNNINPQKMFDFGITFGTAFQIRNDLNSFLQEHSNDKINGIFTAPDIFCTSGDSKEVAIEKTENLIDNKKQRMREVLSELPDSVYKTELKEMIEGL